MFFKNTPVILMNVSTLTMVEFTFAAFITMLALAHTFWTMTTWPDNFELVPSAATVYQEQTAIPEEVSWTGAQVVAKLYQLSDDEISIVVDSITFQSEADVKLKQHLILVTAQYTEEVVINESGEVTQIMFKRIEV